MDKKEFFKILITSFITMIFTTGATTVATYFLNNDQFEKNRKLMLDQLDKTHEEWVKQNTITVNQEKQKYQSELFYKLIELNARIDGLRTNFAITTIFFLNRARAEAYSNSPKLVDYYNNYLDTYRKIEIDSMEQYKSDKAKFKSLLESVRQEYSRENIPAISKNVDWVNQEVDNFYPQIESKVLIDNYVNRIKSGVDENNANEQLKKEFYEQCNANYKLSEAFNSFKASLDMVR
ncbi:hypothetical protein P22_2093 [Propionispora sp. 2/2-37]|uniref:hypothetical protein n=1 Tax=Propionispora sp. 2/2-37 TaxID=1677858 RepID=UPI0006BB6A58|nr:hypothetical protein [Propionispora sp. 2/2-37]CUH96005.1 hypothetical protein P22_2093 [Propionispora sp. 2/2-37]